MMRWLAMDIGCIECGEYSDVVGVFDTKKQAEEASTAAYEAQKKKKWTGQHAFEVFEIEVTI